jgi:hypothetical protein
VRYIRITGIFEVDDKSDPQAFLEALGAWAEEHGWSAQLRVRETNEAAWAEMARQSDS